MKIVCSKCQQVVQRVYVEKMDLPITDVFYCDSHGILRSDIEIQE